MERPKTFADIKGHTWLLEYLEDHIRKGTLHHFLILEGQEGLGKTSIADCIALSLVYGLDDSAERELAYKNVVVKGESNDYIKRYKLSVDGGVNVARDVKAEMTSTFTLDRPKVIICDECHGLTDAAQDVFLSETEFISDKVYMIMLTTEVSKLKASLKSRAVPIHLNTLKQSEMMAVLREEVTRRRLTLQGGDAALVMLAEWSECKPRAGLNILNAFSSGSKVSLASIQNLIGYMEVRDVIPLLASLAGSLTFGLSYISEMQVDSSLVSIVMECLSIKSGDISNKMRREDVSYVRNQLQKVETNQLVKFLYGITRNSKLTRTDVINAYINAHYSFDLLTDSNPEEVIAAENNQRADAELEKVNEASASAPTLDSLLLSSKVIGE